MTALQKIQDLTPFQKTILALVMFTLPIAGIALTDGGAILASSLQSSLCGLGAADTSIQSNAQEIGGGTAWVIQGIAGDCDNRIIGGGGEIQQEDFSGTTEDGEQAQSTSSFQIGMTNFEAWFGQDIQPDKDSVYKVEERVIECTGYSGNPCTDEELQTCQDWQDETPGQPIMEEPDGTTDVGDYTRYSNLQTDAPRAELYCYRGYEEGKIADLALTTESSFNAEFRACANGECGTADMTGSVSGTDTTTTLNVGDVNGDGDTEQAHITWLGSMISSLRDIDMSGYIAACGSNCQQPVTEVDWFPADDSEYEEWFDYNVNGFEECVTSNLNDDFQRQSCIDTMNNRADDVFLDHSQEIENNAGFNVQEVRSQDGQIQVVANKGTAIERPDFRFLIDADWVGLDIPVADPQIQSVTDIDAQAQSTATTTVTVENTADVSGSVQVGVDCPDDAPLSDASQTKDIGIGATTQYSLDIDIGPSQTQEYTCDVYAQDTDSSTTADSGTLTANIETTCTDSDGDLVCDDVDQCPNTPGPESNDGCPQEDGQDSDNDGIIDSNDECPNQAEDYSEFPGPYDGCPESDINQEICSNNVDDDGDGLRPSVDPDCQEPTSQGPDTLTIVLAILLGALIVAFRNEIREQLGTLYNSVVEAAQ